MAELNAYCTKTESYVDRELSWLEFSYRALSETRGKDLPLFERLKFLSITASSLGKFFMMRVASLKDMAHAGYTKPNLAGLRTSKRLVKIGEKIYEFVNMQYPIYSRSLVPTLRQDGLRIVEYHEELTEAEAGYVDECFEENICPVLTPMAVDSSRLFPLIYNKSSNIAALPQRKDGEGDLDFATVQVSKSLPRIVEMPSSGEERVITLLEEIIEKDIHSLFLDYSIISAHPYRIMGNADLTIDEEEVEDLLVEIQKQLKGRQWGEAIHLEIEEKTDKRLLKRPKKGLELGSDDIYGVSGPLDLVFLMRVYGLSGFEELKTPKYMPQQNPAFMNDDNIFANIRKGDILFHHPYESFQSVVEFIQKTTKDPEMLAIRQTLYRISGNSPVIAVLAGTTDNGKQVSVLTELKARFGEESSIIQAKIFRKAGCHVIYSLLGLKTYSKTTLTVRQEEDGICRYIHLGTGNYNDSTVKLYTGCGLFTCHPQIGGSTTAVFNMLSGYSEPLHWNQLIVVPIWLRERFTRMIRRKAENAGVGKTARIIAKVNSLYDRDIIGTLCETSCTGVQIDLIMRGICSLKAGVSGLSENIHVRSIVGNLLGHSHIFCFENDGAPEIYTGSADWTPRNLDRCVEITFPVLDEELKQKILHILQVQLDDNVKTHILIPDGTYERIDRRGRALVNAQDAFCEEAVQAVKDEPDRRDPMSNRVFVPIESHN